MLKVYTGRIGTVGFDITVKSAVGDWRAFAPTWDMVMAHKQGRIDDDEYTKQYLALMRRSYKDNRAAWDRLLAREEVTLLCYCRKGAFCHRRILAGILVKLGAVDMGERQ